MAERPLKPPSVRGKVRDIYDLGDRLLLVASDRISAFDAVLPDDIPHKGEILTKLALFWFDLLSPICENHVLSTDIGALPPDLLPYSDWLQGRSMIVRKADVFPVECIVRGYLSGSGWREYLRKGSVSGHVLSPGLLESAELTNPLFTPSTKATIGHDVNISIEEMYDLIGEEMGLVLQHKALEMYSAAAEYAHGRGIIIADTKFEFGLIDGHVMVVDEILTPDSSRFWPEDEYSPGRPQTSFDKQYVRDWLTELGWDKHPPAPNLPQDVIAKTSEKYIQAYEVLTGEKFVAEGA